jgi:hypothetical protein
MTPSPLSLSRVPTEDAEQVALFQWAEWMKGEFPELALLMHIPNGGARHVVVAKKLKAQGVKSGVPDICLPVKRGSYGSLWIEMKRRQGGKVSAVQRWWLNELEKHGQYAEICYGHEEAEAVIVNYLRIR